MKFSLQTIKRSSPPLVWLITGMLVLLPVGPHTMAGLVLCIEDSGQAFLERAVGTACGSIAQEAKQDADSPVVLAAASTSEQAHCASCIDVVLPLGGDDDCGALTPTETTSSFPLQSPRVALFPSFEFPAEQPEYTLIRPEAAQTPHDLAPLRSVVLLI